MAGYSGDAGDALAAAYGPEWTANGKQFSTPDNDVSPGNCAGSSGWWYGMCSTSDINGAGVSIWWTNYPAVFDVQASRMLVKLNY